MEKRGRITKKKETSLLPPYLKYKQVRKLIWRLSASLFNGPAGATGEGLGTLLPPTQACSNCCHYCCELFVFLRFGIKSSLPENLSTTVKSAIHLIPCQPSGTDFGLLGPEIHKFLPEWAHHSKVLYLLSAEPFFYIYKLLVVYTTLKWKKTEFIFLILLWTAGDGK